MKCVTCITIISIARANTAVTIVAGDAVCERHIPNYLNAIKRGK